MKSLKGTQTAKNLMDSFAAECQARTRYDYYSKIAQEEGYIEISQIFSEIAGQEKQHAKTLYKLLKNDFQGQELEIKENYLVAFSEQTKENLKAACITEHLEWRKLYPKFSEIAKEEGFDDIAFILKKIEEAEKFHEARFGRLLMYMNRGTLFKKDKKVLWICTKCGYVYEGLEPPKVCPACGHPEGYFKVYLKDY